jgi:hypothetical protein
MFSKTGLKDSSPVGVDEPDVGVAGRSDNLKISSRMKGGEKVWRQEK